jgi:hypothetical protein
LRKRPTNQNLKLLSANPFNYDVNV